MTDLISSTEIVAIIERMEVAGTPHQLRLARLAFLRARWGEGVDPRLILRYRRERGLCLNCGRAVERHAWRPATLCGACCETLAYCAACETLYPRRPGLEPGRASEYCTACKSAHQRAAGGHLPYACHLARVRAPRHALLPELIERYTGGQTLPEMAVALGLSRNRVERLIRSARERGEWPEGLNRRAAAHGKPGSHTSDE